LDRLGQQVIRGSITIDEAILHLRGGDVLTDVIAIILFVVFMNWLNGANAFQVNLPPHMDPMGWIQGSYNQPKPGPSSSFSKSGYPSTSLQMQRPSAIPNPEYVGMTREQKRNLPDERDGFITVEGHPHLVARYGQVEYKTPDHGSVHDLPINEKGKTPKTEENAIALRDSILNMPTRSNIVWFDDGMYQGGTERGYPAVNIYDQEKRVIAIFKKQEDGEYSQFATTCKVTAKEETHLFESGGNFVTEAVLNNQKALIIIKNPKD